ncbi:MAG: hypothetical protein Q4A64_00320 [Porphyromonadaceae bacterium]|nr:hypothetical protein [Porphyromonadaceae bacterium]
MTEPSKGSRVWALNTLADHWYLFEGRGMQFKEAWLAKVLGLWDQYKEKEVALFIVNYANEDCVLKMEQDLSKIIGYQKVALRLGGNPNYEINQSALSSLEWLYVMAKLRRPIDVAVCEAILNTMLVDAIKNESLPSSLDGHEFSFALDNQVGLALWCLGELKQPELIMRFFRCDRELQEHLAPWLDRGLSQEEYWRLMCREAPKYFPLPLLRERKREELKALIDCYPILQSLIEKFGLELI